ncbi:hypothetical protein [Pectobacterium brasiliense]|uniref:hypothetical protein n=1 Tax=Pectobacterium brasiliense TaxID=180957 RepID=UPI003CE9428B
MTKNNSFENEIKEEFDESWRMTLHILCTLYLLSLFRNPINNKNKIQEFKSKNINTWSDLFFQYFEILYQENVSIVLNKKKLNSDYLSTIFDNDHIIFDENQMETLNEVLDSLELDIKNDIKNKFIIEYGVNDNRMQIIEKEMDFIFNYVYTMKSVIECIESSKSENKDEMIYMTMSSFSRTLASYVDDCTKPVIKEIIKLGNLQNIKSLKSKKHNPEENKKHVKSLSRKGIGDIIELLYIYFEHSKNNTEIYEKHKEKTKILNEFIASRNKITHNFRPPISNFNFIIKNWQECLSFFSGIIEEYTDNQGFDIYFEKIITEGKKCVIDENIMENRVLPLVKNHA